MIIGNFNTQVTNRVYDCFHNGANNNSEYGNYLYIDDVSVIDTSITDTIYLCASDSVAIGNMYAKSSGIYYDTVEDLIAKTYILMRLMSGSYTEIDMPYHKGDTITIDMRQFCYSDTVRAPFFYCDSIDASDTTLCYHRAYLWPTPDTFIDLKYHNIYGCDSTVRYHLTTTVGIDEPTPVAWLASNGISIYPNPASTSLNISIAVKDETKNQKFTVEIFDAIGRVIRAEKFIQSNAIKIDISALASGIYFVRVLSENNKGIGAAARPVIALGRFVKE